MIIVGSRCGGFEFYVCLLGIKDPIYLGPKKDSDLDILILRGEKIPKSEFKVEVRYLNDLKYYKNFDGNHYFRGLAFPFFSDKLYLPNKNDYLKFNIAKRARMINPMALYKNKDKIIPILDKNLKHLDYIKLSNFN